MTDDTTKNEAAEPLEQQLDRYVAAVGTVLPLDPSIKAMFATIRDMIEQQPGKARELTSARNQRDYLGHQLSDRISRFHALRVAFGETSLDNASRTVAAEIGSLEQACTTIAKQAGIEA